MRRRRIALVLGASFALACGALTGSSDGPATTPQGDADATQGDASGDRPNGEVGDADADSTTADADAGCTHAFCADFEGVTSPAEGWTGVTDAGPVTATRTAGGPTGAYLRVTLATGGGKFVLLHTASASGRTHAVVEWDMRLATASVGAAFNILGLRGGQKEVVLQQDVSAQLHLLLVELDGGASNDISGAINPSMTLWNHYKLDVTYSTASSGAALLVRSGPAGGVTWGPTAIATALTAPDTVALDVGVELFSQLGNAGTVDYDNVTFDLLP